MPFVVTEWAIHYSSSGLGRFDLSTGAGTVLNSSMTFGIDGMDFDSQGNLFAVSQAFNASQNPELFLVDQTTGELDLVGATNIPLDSFHISTAGLSFNNNDQLFWTINRKLFELDTQTGQGTFVTDLQWGGASSGATGLTFVNAIPEPGTGFLLGALVLTLGCGVRRR